MTADEVKRLLNLEPLEGEGGYFRRTYLSERTVLLESEKLTAERPISSAIFYLVTAEMNGFSRLHSLRSPEIYHFYLGDPVRLALFPPEGRPEMITMGQDIGAGQCLQICVPAGTVQGLKLEKGGDWALLGTTMSPAFDEKDFKLIKGEDLLKIFPGYKNIIREFTGGSA